MVADKAALVDYLRTGKRPALEWKLEPNADGIVPRLLSVAGSMPEMARDYARELHQVAMGLAAASGGSLEEYQQWVFMRYGRLSEKLWKQALADAADDPPSEGLPQMATHEFVTACDTVLRATEMDRWSTELRQGIAARVMISGYKVIVREGETFTRAEFVRLMVHEIGTHAFRRANADDQQDLVLKYTPFSDSWTEEGLAVWNERAAGVSSPRVERLYASRVLAVGTALESGIFDVLDILRDVVEPTLAADLAIRVKRGVQAPESKGAFTKDLAYLGGYLDVARELQARPSNHRLLMAAKWPLSRIGELESYRIHGVLREARRLPGAVAAIAKAASCPER
jgi:hypothetical protein